MGGEGGNEGIGFAIPINMAHSVMDQIVGHGKVLRGYLGLLPQDINSALAKQFGLTQAGGALVAEVTPDTPASKAGIKQGDVILKVNGDPVDSANSLRLRISQTAPGSSVRLQISRDGKVQDMNVTLGEYPAEKNDAANSNEGNESGGTLKGVQVQALNSEMQQQLHIPNSVHGVVVTSVDPSSAAGATDLSQGDVIEEVNHKPVTSIESYRQAIASAGDKPVLLLVYLTRGGGQNYILVDPQQ